MPYIPECLPRVPFLQCEEFGPELFFMLEANHCRVVFHLSDYACTTYKCWICIVSRKICHTQRSMERCKRQPLYRDPTQVYHQCSRPLYDISISLRSLCTAYPSRGSHVMVITCTCCLATCTCPGRCGRLSTGRNALAPRAHHLPLLPSASPAHFRPNCPRNPIVGL